MFCKASKSCRFDRTTRPHIDFWRWRIFKSSGVINGHRAFISFRKDTIAGATASDALVNFLTILSTCHQQRHWRIKSSWHVEAVQESQHLGSKLRFIYFCGSVSSVESLFAYNSLDSKVAETGEGQIRNDLGRSMCFGF